MKTRGDDGSRTGKVVFLVSHLMFKALTVQKHPFVHACMFSTDLPAAFHGAAIALRAARST
jgi:hypothetical protein